LKVGLFTFFSLIAFLIIFIVWRWVERHSVLDRIATAANEIKKRLPDLAVQAEVKKSTLSGWLFPLTLTFIPIILALVNQEWMFTQAGETDPWSYISLGYYYFKDPSLVPRTPYKLSRVPWILIESFIRNLFTPTTAAIVLTLIFVILASIGFYLLVSRFFGKEVGFISTALLSTYSYYMVNRSPDYHNAAGSLFLIWSLYCLTRAIQSKNRQRGWFFACGVVFGLGVHSELFLLGCLPAMIVQFFMLSWTGRKRPVLEAILFGLLGFLSITALLGLAAVLSGRSFFFFMDQIRQVAVIDGSINSFYQPKNSGWPLQAKHLALPVAAFLFASGWLVKDAIKIFRLRFNLDCQSWLRLSINLQMVLMGIIWLALEIAKKEALIHNHYVNPVDIYSFLVFAGFLALGWRKRISPIILGVIPLAICLSLVFSDRIFGAIGSRLFPDWQIFQPLLFYLLIFAGLILLKRQPLAVLSLVVLMCLGNIVGMSNRGNALSLISPSVLSLSENQCHTGRDGYLSVIDSFTYLQEFGWTRTHVWWDESESIPVNNCPEPKIKISLIGSSVIQAGFRNMKNNTPCPPIESIPAAYYASLTKNNAVVSVITNHPSKANQMLAKLSSYGNWLLAKKETISQGDIHFSIYVFSLDGKIR
jgi:4-amino-4-deoxy-L-arabinose transferase-like glycosyltransferase